jgi:type I restriction-modification system DNA methylase subunit
MLKVSLAAILETCREESLDKVLINSEERQKKLGEVFTPTELVLEILLKLPIETWNDGKTFLDPTCGNGQFLSSILIIKMLLGHVDPLKTIYGVDIMEDNVKVCRKRLLEIAGDNEENRKIIKKNIICKDGLTYDYSFS